VSGRFSSDFLRALRNDVPIDDLIRSHLELAWKEREGYLRFLCPRCGELHTATNPKTNLARCFRCAVSFNPIELVMAVEHCAFVDAVRILAPLLEARRQALRMPRAQGVDSGEQRRIHRPTAPANRTKPI
jgi:DNA primase